MNTPPVRSPLPFRLALTAMLAGACVNVLAAEGVEGARQRGKLMAGIHYPVPEYKGGMKFRTPEAIDTALLEDLAKRLQAPLATVRAESGKQAALLASGTADIALLTLAENDARAKNLQGQVTLIPTGYSSGPMAIMRTDTDIKTWEQLKGRKVCVAEGGHHVGTLAAKYGAVEHVHRAPADSLLALRIGTCDAAVHDSAMLEELIKLPEWKKFSARLPTGPRSTLVFAVPAEDRKGAAFLKQVAREWASKGYVKEAMTKAVRHIAFEVYLDQDVPDCH